MHMKKLIYWVVIVSLLFTAGCAFSRQNIILSETEQYYLIPAGQEFTAVVVKGQKPIKVTRDKDSWVVDAGVLSRLQTEANENVLGLDDN